MNMGTINSLEWKGERKRGLYFNTHCKCYCLAIYSPKMSQSNSFTEDYKLWGTTSKHSNLQWEETGMDNYPSPLPSSGKQTKTNQPKRQPTKKTQHYVTIMAKKALSYIYGRSIFIKCIILRIYSAATLFWLHHAKRTFRKQIGAKNLPNGPPSRTADWPLEIWFIVQIRIDSFFYHGGGLLLEPSLFANTPSGCISWDHGVRSTSKWTNTEYNKI